MAILDFGFDTLQIKNLSFWLLLIVDGHTSRACNYVALDVLNTANILVTCLPLIERLYLQSFLRSISQHIQSYDQMQVKNLPL